MTREEALYKYLLRLADNNMILTQRLSEWIGRTPILEEEMAVCNVSLDLLGQANAFYQYAAKLEGEGRTEDDLAFLRDEREFYNALLCEQPNGDFAQTICRQLIYSAYQQYLYNELKESSDNVLASLAKKAHKEVTYHVRHFTGWTIRLGNGTTESHQRMQNGINELWRFTDDLFEMNETDTVLLKENIAVNLNNIREEWYRFISDILIRATVKIPENVGNIGGSKSGKHTEHLGRLLAEMQYLYRSYPGVTW